MSETFLSEPWFHMVKEIQKEAAGPGGVTMNLVVQNGPGGERRVHVAGNRFFEGHAKDAAATITLPFTVAHAIFVEGKFREAMPAYTSGQIQIDGEISALAGIARSEGDALRQLRDRLLRITKPVGEGASLTGVAGDRERAALEIARLRLEPYVRDLEVNGYAVIPREVTGMTTEFIDRVREKVFDLIEKRSGVRPDVETGETHRNVFYPSLYYFLFEDRIFEELLLNEYALAMASHVCGLNCVLSACTVFMKGPAEPPKTGSKLQLHLHADNHGWGLPEPYSHPSESMAVNCSWLLTDYTAADGATVFVPGSHFLRRMPIGLEGEDRIVPIEAPRGTLVVWGSNTWHGGLPRSKPGLRLGLAWALARPYLTPQEPFQLDVTEEMLARNPPRFSVLMGQSYPTGWRGEGPERLMESRAKAAAKRRAAT